MTPTPTYADPLDAPYGLADLIATVRSVEAGDRRGVIERWRARYDSMPRSRGAP